MVKKNDKNFVNMVRTVAVDSTLAPLAVRDWRCQRNLQHNLLYMTINISSKIVSIFGI